MSRDGVPLLTIAIPTFNSMTGNNRVDRLLNSIVNQTAKNFEVIVVDNLSTDLTSEVCRKFHTTFIEARSTISHAGNIALSKARGKYILFLDSDMELPSSFLEDCFKTIDCMSPDCLQLQFHYKESRRPSFLNIAKLRNTELKMGAAPLNIYLYSTNLIGDTRYPESEKQLVGEEYIFRNRVLRKRPKIGLVKSKINHFLDPSLSWVARRSFKYGKWFTETEKHLSASDAARFFKYNSILKKKSLTTFLNLIRTEPRTVFPFLLYVSVKYLSFLFGYLSERPGIEATSRGL